MRSITKKLFATCASTDIDNPQTCAAAKQLIDDGADPNGRRKFVKVKGVIFVSSIPFEEEITPLFVACYRGNLDLARLLFDSGARDDRALVAAAMKCWVEVGRKRHAERIVFQGKKLQLVTFLIERGFSLSSRLASGRTSLCAASEAGRCDIVKFLLRRGARIDDCVCPPLVAACNGLYLASEPNESACFLEVARLLLESGADPKVYNKNGTSLAATANKCSIYKAAFAGLAQMLLNAEQKQ